MWKWGGSPPLPTPSWWWIFITRTGPVCSRRRGSPPPVPTPPRSGLRFGMAQTTVGTSPPSPIVRGGGGRGASALTGGGMRPGGVVGSCLYPSLSLVSLAETLAPLLDNSTPGITPGPIPAVLYILGLRTLGVPPFRKHSFTFPSTSWRGNEAPWPTSDLFAWNPVASQQRGPFAHPRGWGQDPICGLVCPEEEGPPPQTPAPVLVSSEWVSGRRWQWAVAGGGNFIRHPSAVLSDPFHLGEGTLSI